MKGPQTKITIRFWHVDPCQECLWSEPFLSESLTPQILVSEIIAIFLVKSSSPQMDWKLIVSWICVLLLLFLYVHGILGKRTPSWSLAVIQWKWLPGMPCGGALSPASANMCADHQGLPWAPAANGEEHRPASPMLPVRNICGLAQGLTSPFSALFPWKQNFFVCFFPPRRYNGNSWSDVSQRVGTQLKITEWMNDWRNRNLCTKLHFKLNLLLTSDLALHS